MANRRFAEDINMAYLNMHLQLFAAVIMIILFAGNRRSGLRRGRSMRLFYYMIGCDICMLLAGGFDNYVLYKEGALNEIVPIEPLLAGLSDMCYFMVLAFFILFIDIYEREDGRISSAALTGAVVSFINGIIWFVTDFGDGIYVQDADGIMAGPFYIAGQIGGYITAGLSVVIIARRWKEYNNRERAGFSLFVLLPFIGSLLKGVLDNIILMPLMVTLSIVIIQSYIQVARELLIHRQTAELGRMRGDILMSKMKPHFIYNTLNTIYALCDISSEEARNAIAMFSTYLRSSLVDVDIHRLIPFKEELEHVRNYLDIEKVRFSDSLSVEYDIRAVDFVIPPLALQAIVENAVQYGIEKKPGGGTVRISTDMEGEEVKVTVSDTGVGFDTGKISLDRFESDEKGRRHVGLYSAAYRVKNLCGGCLEIDSRPGEGTTVIMKLKRGTK